MLILDQLKRSEPQLRVMALGILLGMSVLFAGLWWVQVISSKRYQTNLENQSFRTVRVPAIRGKIFDRNHLVLADNRPSYTVNLYLEELRSYFKPRYLALKKQMRESDPGVRFTSSVTGRLGRQARYDVISNTVYHLGQVLEMDLSITERQLHDHWLRRRALAMPVAKNLSAGQIARFWETPFNHTGIDLDIQPTREYPHGSTAAHVLGHLTRDTGSADDLDGPFDYRLPSVRGHITGVEGVFDRYLRGMPGGKTVLVNNVGYRESESRWMPTEPGQNLYLTLDLDIQAAAEAAMKSHVGGHVRGAVVVMNPQNGDLLALVSLPAFDPNDFPGISRKKYARLNDPETKAFYNRASQETYPPGSTFKIVVGLACLEAGTMTPEEQYYSRGYYPIGNGMDDTAPAGHYDFRRAFIKSSNSYFIHYGLKAGARTIVDMGNRFFLGQPTGIPIRQDSPGHFPDLEDLNQRWYDGDTANICIGQGRLDTTPLQMAGVTSAIVNGGKIHWPRLVAEIVPQKPQPGRGAQYYPTERVRGTLGVSPRNLDIVRNAMLADVSDPNGTGGEAAVPGMSIGGKTGTAEVEPPNRAHYKVTWFVSFGDLASRPDPRYAVVVVVEYGGSGGKTCAPIARKIYETIKQIEMGNRSFPNELARE